MPAKINANLIRILQKYLLLPVLYFSVSSNVLAQYSNDSLFQQKKVLQDSLIKSGYFEAQVRIEDSASLQTNKGRAYYWGDLVVYENSLPINVAFAENLEGTIANQYLLQRKLKEYVRKNYHRKGYPLAKASLHIRNVNDNQIDASVNVYRQNFIVYDSLVVRGDSQSINQVYLSNVLDLKYDKPFDIKSFENIAEKIAQLQYLSLSASPELIFANNKAIISLGLEEEKANRFDAIIGVIPENSRTNITGQVDVGLRNLFKRGVGMDLFWQKYSVNSQLLKTRIQQSYAFKSSLGFDLGFELLQEDSTFLQTDLKIGAYIPIQKLLTLGLSYQRFNNIILRDFSENEVSSLLPMRTSLINGLILNLDWKNKMMHPQLIDYSFAQLSFGVGYKQIDNFSALPEAWQDVPRESSNISGGIKFHIQKVLGKRFLLEAIPQYRSFQNSALSQNDLLRLGGLQDLRGFDRNFFYTRYFALLNLNYRYFLDQRSSFFLLTDFAKLQSNIGWVYAIGAGLDIKSRNGWFRIVYALGQQAGNMPEFSQGKVHFGYIAVF